jgi:surface antigen
MVLAIFMLALTPTPSLAKGKSKHAKGHVHVHHPAKAAKIPHRAVVFQRGGPPPWAPAHGLRRKYGDRQSVYVAPYGIDSGTCRRNLLAPALGATAGGLLASEVSGGDAHAVVGGVLLGALLGGAIGDAMDGVDRGCVGQVLEHAPPSETVTWRNPNENADYAVTPTNTYQTETGRYCREFTTTVTIDGREEVAYGTACRQPDGSWERG